MLRPLSPRTLLTVLATLSFLGAGMVLRGKGEDGEGDDEDPAGEEVRDRA